MAHFLLIADIAALFHSENDDVKTSRLSNYDWMRSSIPVIMLPLAFWWPAILIRIFSLCNLLLST